MIVLATLNCSIALTPNFAPPSLALIVLTGVFILVLSSILLSVFCALRERGRLVDALQRRTAALLAVLENNPMGIVIFDRTGRVTSCNPAFEKLTLYNQRDLAQSETARLEGISTALAEAFAGHACLQTVRQKRKNGEILDLRLRAIPLIVKDNVQGACVIYEDLPPAHLKTHGGEGEDDGSHGGLRKELKRRTQQMKWLNETGSLLQGCATIDEIAAIAGQSLQKLFPDAASGTLYLSQSTEAGLSAASSWGAAAASHPSFRPGECTALHCGGPSWSDLREPKVGCDHLQKDSSAQCLCVPMVTQGETLGVLHLEFAPPDWAADDGTGESNESRQALAEAVARQVALSLTSIRLRQNLREQVIRDPLTRLFNRRFLEECLALELERAARGHYPVSLLFLDLDQFKRFNDTFGHESGDVMLRSLGVLLRTFFRATDICCRAGGEEFAIILPRATPENAVVRANALRLEIKNLKHTHEDKPLGPVTISAGLAAYPDHAETAAELLRVAQRCMGDSKTGGGDRATVPAAKTFQRGA